MAETQHLDPGTYSAVLGTMRVNTGHHLSDVDLDDPESTDLLAPQREASATPDEERIYLADLAARHAAAAIAAGLPSSGPQDLFAVTGVLCRAFERAFDRVSAGLPLDDYTRFRDMRAFAQDRRASTPGHLLGASLLQTACCLAEAAAHPVVEVEKLLDARAALQPAVVAAQDVLPSLTAATEPADAAEFLLIAAERWRKGPSALGADGDARVLAAAVSIVAVLEQESPEAAGEQVLLAAAEARAGAPNAAAPDRQDAAFRLARAVGHAALDGRWEAHWYWDPVLRRMRAAAGEVLLVNASAERESGR